MISSEKEILNPYQNRVNEILTAAENCNNSTKKELKEKLLSKGYEQKSLAEEARKARFETGEASLVVRASLEFSNFCKQTCSFCGMTVHNKKLERYRMTETQIEAVIKNVASLGIKDLHLASGEDWSFKVDSLASVISIAIDYGMEVTLVTSQRKLNDYKILKNAGASRYILKVETTSHTLFKEARTGTHLPTRIAHLLYLREIGFKIGSGVICGLPNQIADDLVNDLIFLRELQPDMASVSRFLPNHESLYENKEEGDPDLTLNFLSLIRIQLSHPGLRIPAGTTLGRRQSDAINHGANVLSLHVTPEEYAILYSADQIKERNMTEMKKIMEFAKETALPLRFQL